MGFFELAVGRIKPRKILDGTSALVEHMVPELFVVFHLLDHPSSEIRKLMLRIISLNKRNFQRVAIKGHLIEALLMNHQKLPLKM